MVCLWKETFHKVSSRLPKKKKLELILPCLLEIVFLFVLHIVNELHIFRTGYERHMKAYTSPVQSSSSIIRGAPGADGVDMSGKVVVITG
jgi:hypothetical protein